MRNAIVTIVAAVVLTSAPAWADIAPDPAEQIAAVCPGDLNGDNVVDSADLASILGSYGICRGCDEDLNHDGYVDETDVKILAFHWGSCASDEGVITQSARALTSAPDDSEVYEGDGDVPTNDDAFFEVEQATCEGDLDRDGQIDSTDLAMLLAKYGRCRGCEEDLNGDGVVDEEDVDIMLDAWGKCREEEEVSTDVSRSPAGDGGSQVEEDLPPQNEPVEEEPQCPGDLDGNGTIDSTDLAMMLTRYGRCRGCKADLNGDGYVDQRDIDMLLASWGECVVETPTNVGPKGESSPASLTGG